MFTVRIDGAEPETFKAHQVRLMHDCTRKGCVGQLFCDTADGQRSFDIGKKPAATLTVLDGKKVVATYQI